MQTAFGEIYFLSRDGVLGDPSDGCSPSGTSVTPAPHLTSTASAGKWLLDFRKKDFAVSRSVSSPHPSVRNTLLLHS